MAKIKAMKKRLCKKFHKGDFKEVGVSIRVSANADTAADVLGNLATIADDNGLVFCGGGIGHFITPNEKYGNLTMPKKVEDLMLALIPEPYLLTDCVVGYYTNPSAKIISADKIESMKAAINALNVEHGANYSVDLWN